MEPFIAQVITLGDNFTGGVRVASGDVSGAAAAASDHREWIIIESMSSPIFR